MAATIKDIAKITSLGYATISAYLNGINVRPINKIAIEKAIDELGYIRNEYARGLKTRRTMTIGALIPDLANVFSTTIISAMEDKFRELGYGVIICDCKNCVELERASLDFLLSKMVDGLIVIPIASDGNLYNKVLDNNIPIVSIDRITDNCRLPSITINNRQASFDAVNQLVTNGHQEIAIITGDDDVYTARERFLGYKSCLEVNGLFNQDLVYNGGMVTDKGYYAMKNIIENNQATAVFVDNYEMMIGALIAINESSKSIPDDFSFIGFDTADITKVYRPKLTTVNQPLSEMGTKACEMLLDKINNKEISSIELKASFETGATIKKLN